MSARPKPPRLRWIGVDPASGKSHAVAWQRADGTWRWERPANTATALRDTLQRAIADGAGGVAVEDGYVGVNPRVSRALDQARGIVRSVAELLDQPCVPIQPSQWRSSELSWCGWTPHTTGADCKAMALRCVRLAHRVDTDDHDVAEAICIAAFVSQRSSYGESIGVTG